MMAMALFGPFNERWGVAQGDDAVSSAARRRCCSSFILFMGLWPAPFVDRISETVTHLPGVS